MPLPPSAFCLSFICQHIPTLRVCMPGEAEGGRGWRFMNLQNVPPYLLVTFLIARMKAIHAVNWGKRAAHFGGPIKRLNLL
jgi:hypothetical protein